MSADVSLMPIKYPSRHENYKTIVMVEARFL